LTSGSEGSRGVLPNSVMSAPPLKVRPPPVSTTQVTSGSASARFIASITPFLTSNPKALTGGLLIVTTATAPSTE
jgi:hypothetical protein